MDIRFFQPPLRAPDGLVRTGLQRLTAENDRRFIEFADSPADRRLDHLVENSELLDMLMSQGYRGRNWMAFSRALAEYGYQVVFAWCLSGEIFVECARKGFGAISRPSRPIERDDASELAGETVAASLPYFRDQVLVPRIWDPARGASLKTFFIGACVLVFANVYRRWRLENGKFSFEEDKSGLSPAVPSDAAYAYDLHRLLLGLNPRDRDLLQLSALGYTQIEIAGLLGTTRKAVERRLERLRNGLRSSR